MEPNICLLLLGAIVVSVSGNRLRRETCADDFCQLISISICENGGTCQQIPPNCGVTCQCPSGFSGDTCQLETGSENGTESSEECEDACLSKSPCLNGGSCVWNATACAPSCQCPHGFNGTLCESGPRCPAFNWCEHLPCENGASCIRNSECHATCVCKEGFSGNFCQTPIYNEPCGNLTCVHGRCVRNEFCKCDKDFAGIECSEFCYLDCRTGTCVLNDKGNETCHCDPPFYGPRCRSMMTTTCTPETTGSHRCDLHVILWILVFVFILSHVT